MLRRAESAPERSKKLGMEGTTWYQTRPTDRRLTPGARVIADFVDKCSAGALIVALLAAGCASRGVEQRDRTVDRPNDLEVRLRNFHRYMRWENFHRAASFVHHSHRSRFLGHYADAGEGFDIVSLEVKLVESPRPGQRLIEVRQRWVVEPEMNVRDERYIERWEKASDGWRLMERTSKDQWQPPDAEAEGPRAQ